MQVLSGLMRSSKELRQQLMQKLYAHHEFLFSEQLRPGGHWCFPILLRWNEGLTFRARIMVRRVHLNFDWCHGDDAAQLAALNVFASLPVLKSIRLKTATQDHSRKLTPEQTWRYWALQVIVKICEHCPQLSKIYHPSPRTLDLDSEVYMCLDTRQPCEGYVELDFKHG